KRGTSTLSESSDGAQNIWQDLDTQLPPALPDELLGWIMLRRSGLNPTQRLNVLSAIQNSLKAEAVERGLRAAEEELRFMERDSGKGHGGGKGRGGRSFWVEQDGQRGILLSSEDIFEDITDQASIHWVEAPSHAPVEEAFTAELAVDPYIEQFWNHEDDGAYTLWKQDPMDGEYYFQDGNGVFWSWSQWETEAAWWAATPEEQKQQTDAATFYQDKPRTFSQARQLMAAKGASRGCYGKGKGKGKKGGGKTKGQPTQAVLAATTTSTPSAPVLPSVLAATPGKGTGKTYGKGHVSFADQVFSVDEVEVDEDDWVNPNSAVRPLFPPGEPYPETETEDGDSAVGPASPARGAPAGTQPDGETFVVEPDSPARMTFPGGHPGGESISPAPAVPGIILMAIQHPDVEGFGVLDTGATETVASLGAVEKILEGRRLNGLINEPVSVVPQEKKCFRFGNGQRQFSESYMLLPQTVGGQLFHLGVYTLDAAIIDLGKSLIVMKAVDPYLVIPLIRSTTGHLLLNMRTDWMGYGQRDIHGVQQLIYGNFL
ncbi:unnamed protein product, partial [Effrenium voratum]